MTPSSPRAVRLLALVAPLLVALALLPLRAQPIPAGGQPLLGDPTNAIRLVAEGNAREAGELSVVDATGRNFTHALRIETRRDVGPALSVSLRAPTTAPAERGHVGLIHFFARTIAASDETGGAQLRVVVRATGTPATTISDSQFTIAREWTEYFMPFTFGADYAAGGAEFVLGVGAKRQTLEIGGVALLDFGNRATMASLPRTRFTYAGREPDAAWRREALERIERIRKSDFSIAVLDGRGQPASGATLRIEQRRAAFQFGTALQFARLVQDTPDNRRYRELTLELFNAASPENDLKWPVWLGEWSGSYSREQSLQALQWLREHKLPTRGHVMVWPSWRNLPNALGALRGTPRENEMPKLVLEHIAQIGKALGGYLEEWDVLNEPWDNHDLMDKFGRDLMADWFVAARAVLPNEPLYLNDYSNHDATTDRAHVEHFEETARFLLEKKAPLTGLGLQAHIGSRPNAPVNVLAVLDRYAKFNLPLRITEFDINTDDEELQADYTRDFLILMFSHASVVGVQHWGFWERAHWRPRAALFRADWSEKPNAKAYRDLVLKQWRTQLDGRTGYDGRFAARGFHGDYVVSAELNGRRVEKAFSLQPGQPAPRIDLRLPE